MTPKNFLKSAIAGFTAIAMAAALLPYDNINILMLNITKYFAFIPEHDNYESNVLFRNQFSPHISENHIHTPGNQQKPSQDVGFHLMLEPKAVSCIHADNCNQGCQ